MMRLTKKLDNCYHIIHNWEERNTFDDRNKEDFAIQKLGQLEDIEEELGIDLITLSKLFKEKYVYAYDNVGIRKCTNDYISIYDKKIQIYNGVCVISYPLNEYGKSFALTKEELL